MAKDRYISDLFRKVYQYAQLLNPNMIFILSAKWYTFTPPFTGVRPEDLATEEEIAAKRQARAQQQQAMQAAQVASKGYKETNEVPEQGSPAEKVMTGMGA